jgi:flavin reductase (DIM6/NTAB) family NADH-FMN oxidoreductase RutF
MAKVSFPLSEVYCLIEPGPVILMTTVRNGKANIMAQSWHTMMEFEPPLMGCIVSDRNHSYSTLQATGECVINIPSVELAEKVVGCGNTTGAEIDKFEKFRLTPESAARVEAPLVKECFASLECKVVDTSMVDHYGLFVLEVVAAWLDHDMKNHETIHHLGHGNFMIAGRNIHLRSKAK